MPSIIMYFSMLLATTCILTTPSVAYDPCKNNYQQRKYSVKDGLSGIITSPLFNSRSCENDYKLEIEFSGETDDTDKKYRVQLEIFQMNLNHDKDDSEIGSFSTSQCDHSDYIKVWVKVGASKREIASLCGTSKAHKMMSTNQYLWMEYVRRGETAQPGIGFNASYHFVTNFGLHSGLQINNHDKECMFEYYSSTAKNGTFTSPNYPGLYPRNTECYYIFKGSKAEKIYINFVDFNVEGTNNCEDGTLSDFVEFSNFNIGLIDRKMDRFCGSNLAKTDVQSDGSFFRVTFVSNNAYDSTGFEAHYQFKAIEEQQPEAPKDKGATARNGVETSIPHHFLSLLFIFSYYNL